MTAVTANAGCRIACVRTHFQRGATFCSPHKWVWYEGRRHSQPPPQSADLALGLPARVYKRRGAACLSTRPSWIMLAFLRPHKNHEKCSKLILQKYTTFVRCC